MRGRCGAIRRSLTTINERSLLQMGGSTMPARDSPLPLIYAGDSGQHRRVHFVAAGALSNNPAPKNETQFRIRHLTSLHRPSACWTDWLSLEPFPQTPKMQYMSTRQPFRLGGFTCRYSRYFGKHPTLVISMERSNGGSMW